MGIFRRGKKRKEEEEAKEHARNVTYAEESQPMSEEDRAMIYSLGRSVYMIQDPDFNTWLLDEENKLRNSYPAFSMVNRTTNIGQHDKELLLLDYEYLLLINKLNMNEDEYENEGWASLAAMDIYARYMVNDSLQGWKGRLVTEQIKHIVTEIQKTKKRGLLPF
uniref:Uncharacterized protein n=1 Tax=viral metagenome TaxID=1070528 RepID=A0A6H1ZYQ4_9ZZZZ